MQERQADEIQPGVTLDYATAVLRLAISPDYGQVDPMETSVEAVAPDDIGNSERTPVIEQRKITAHTNDARYPLYAGGHQVPSLHSDQWGTLGQNRRACFAARPRVDRQDMP